MKLFGYPVDESENLPAMEGGIVLGTLDEYNKARDKAIDTLLRVISQREIEIPAERLEVLE